MKKLFIILSLFLVACSQTGEVSDATEGEIQMAEMMGITVEELRSQTPEEHMQMMMEMHMEGSNGTEGSEGAMNGGFLPGKDLDHSAFPTAQPSEVIETTEGEFIELSPRIVKRSLNGNELIGYGYNAQIPGPLIRAKQNETFKVRTENSIDQETTVHWHGTRLENKHDGVPNITQEPIKPGAFHWSEVRVPDEGIYWYHPHVREDIQQDLGLYGNLFVMPENKDAYAPVNQEEFLILDDLLLDDDRNLIPYGEGDETHALMGRFGNTMLINGQLAENYMLETKRGSVTRFFLTNVANTRTFRIRIDGGAMKLVGSDVGRYEKEEWIDTVTIAPAERYIIDVLFEDDGQYRITHEPPTGDIVDLGNILVSEDDTDTSYETEFQTLKGNDDVVADIDAFRPEFDRDVDKTLHLSVDWDSAHMMHHDEASEGIEWEDSMPAMNEVSSKENTQWKLIDEETGDENMDINWEFELGSVAKIRIINDEDSDHPMHHPIHFHGQRFLVLSMDGVKNENLVWKDTVLVPRGSTADLLFDMSNPGKWMFHCHIAEHLTNGMMGMLHVVDPDADDE